jgi:hypothetical protein
MIKIKEVYTGVKKFPILIRRFNLGALGRAVARVGDSKMPV